ncbi:MBL fold metallo-hydrolase [Chitinophaga qingshengii]|uniref:MBL fold metallo-hydrolase n=1 Tax=Chitinophaga qingshengii TaxID=1569794 RepID=A0ABR7TWS4_9BACT|nr:MBL fold metallo-hydrolase [Chitinophaga qingshengii]MBC9934898.1 MBL fold metallo-hydrolase [Chitinophaga qingshengii]
MKEKLMYLMPNVVMEPLFDRWYAWSHLVSPATAAMNITGRHLRIMNSYIQASHIHAAAVKNPKMRGGPFMDLGGGKVEDVKALRDHTLSEHADLVALSEAFKELDRLLLSKAKGFTLQPLYKEIPEILKGYVELVYDLNNHPSYRIFESLLYSSPYYKTGAQSVAISITNNDERPFVLSTPRLNEPGVLHLNIPFADKAIDKLAMMKRTPGDVDEIAGMLGIGEEDRALFNTFFTETPPKPYQPYTGNKVRMRYFGHACILVETKDISILIDPVVSYYGYPQEVDRFSDMDLPEHIDYVLITHNHQDHILFETLLPLRHRIGNLVVPRTSSGALQDPNLRLMFNSIGFHNVIEIEDMQTIKFHDCSITGLPFIGEHGDLNIQTKICHHVKVGNFTMLFMADSCNVSSELYKHIHQKTGDVDVVFLGMECEGAPLSWLYGPLMTEELSRDRDQTRRFAGSDFEQGRALAEIFNPHEMYVYAMGQEPWLEFISSIKYTPESHPIVQSNKLVEYCTGRGIITERLFGEKEILYSKVKEGAELS